MYPSDRLLMRVCDDLTKCENSKCIRAQRVLKNNNQFVSYMFRPIWHGGCSDYHVDTRTICEFGCLKMFTF